MEFYQMLASLMHRRNMTVPEVARACGLSDSTVRSILDRKQKKIAFNVALKLSRGLDIPLESLAGEDHAMREPLARELNAEEARLVRQYRRLDAHGRELVQLILDKELERVTHTEPLAAAVEMMIVLPLPLQPASAGTGELADDEACETLQVRRNALTAKADYAMRAHGDSMEPRIHDGDLLLIRTQPAVEPGEIGIFIRSGERFVKVYRGRALESLNPAYAPLPLDESTRCVGKVLGVLDPAWLAN